MVQALRPLLLFCCASVWCDVAPELDPFNEEELAKCLDIQRRAIVWAGSDHGCDVRYMAYPSCRSPMLAENSCALSASQIYECHFGELVNDGELVISQTHNVTKDTAIVVLELVHDLSAFSMHIGRRPIDDILFVLYQVVGHRLIRLRGGFFPKPPILSDRRGLVGDVRTEELTQYVDALYHREGVWIRPIDSYIPSFVSSVRGMEALPSARDRAGCELLGAEGFLCECLAPGKRLDMGWSVGNADVEAFIGLSELVAQRPQRVFAVGNAFGYSTVVLGLLFARQAAGGSIDVIDAETEGRCNPVGSWITRRIVTSADLDVKLTSGLSPHNVPRAMRFPSYDFAFIDGEHTLTQLIADIGAVLPRMSPAAIVVLHDIGWWNLHAAVDTVPAEWERHPIRGRAYKNMVGTLLLHRGFSSGLFDHL